MAHKKAGGSAKNLRDSQPKYRGVKVFGGQKVLPGNIIIRQNGSKYECGDHTYLGNDFSIHADVAGVVAFKTKKFERFDGRKYIKTVVFVQPE
jgi:large subunit ribosomal protein L27